MTDDEFQNCLNEFDTACRKAMAIVDHLAKKAAERPVQTLSEHKSIEHGIIRLEAWPEGLVLWVGGQIRWRSWV